MIIPTIRFPTWVAATIAVFALTYGVIMVFALHRHHEYWALVVGLTFAFYLIVPKLPEEPGVKPEKYTLFDS